MGKKGAILKITLHSVGIIIRLTFDFLRFKFYLYSFRKKNSRLFRRSISGMPKELKDKLASEYDYKLKMLLNVSVWDVARRLNRG